MPTRPKHLEELVHFMASLIEATEAAAFAVLPDFFAEKGLKPLVHIRPDESDAEVREAAIQAFADIMLPCLQQSKDGAIEISGTENNEGKQFCIIHLARQSNNAIAGAVAFIVRRPDQRAAERALVRVQWMSHFWYD